MSEKQLNDLPEEILLQVFDKMDFKTLMASSLVCRNWNEMIEENSAIMNKIKLVVNISCQDIRMLSEDFTRNYRSIIIDGDCKEFNWKLLERQASNLRKLEIYRCEIKEENKGNFKKFLASMTKLESLRIFNTFCDIDLTLLNHLKSLDLYRCTVSQFLKFPETAQLTSLNLFGLLDFKPSTLISFLADQKILEDLSIQYCKAAKDDNINWETMKTIQFPLKKLSLKKYGWLGLDETKLIFLNKFIDSLEELEIGKGFPASVYKTIFNKFHKLNTLTADIVESPQEDSFYNSLNRSLSIRKLVVHGFKPDLKWIKGFIGKLPNLHTLVLPYPSQSSKEHMMFIAGNLNKIEDLQVSDISHEAFEGVNIPSLKTFRIYEMDRMKHQNWKQIVNAMPNVEELKFAEFGDQNLLNDENIKIISEGWPKLKHIKLGHEIVASKEIFGLLLAAFKELQTIEIFEKAFQGKSDPEKEEVLREVERDGFRIVIVSNNTSIYLLFTS